MFKKILIANRGEIAMRILHAAKELGIKTVAVYSDVDSNLLHLQHADERYCVGPAHVKDSYLNAKAILHVAKLSKAEAIHPGYGFFAENADFIKSTEDDGIVFVGPSSTVTALLANKIHARKFACDAGLHCVPGTYTPLGNDTAEIQQIVAELGCPVIVKAALGGGGRAMRIVHHKDAIAEAIDIVKKQALEDYNNDDIYIEKFLPNAKHIELQIMADKYGNVVQLGLRDSSIQVWNKKFIEESIPVDFAQQLSEQVAAKCTQLCKDLKYSGAITFEFLYSDGVFYFTEANTRIQAAHSITELTTDVDLIKEQIKIAAGEQLSIEQTAVQLHGHAIECRVYADQPKRQNISSQTITEFHAPGGPGIRVDSHIYSGYVMPANYDRLIVKISAYSATRLEAINRMQCAFEELQIRGVSTNISLIQSILADPVYIAGDFNSMLLERRIGLNYSE